MPDCTTLYVQQVASGPLISSWKNKNMDVVYETALANLLGMDPNNVVSTVVTSTIVGKRMLQSAQIIIGSQIRTSFDGLGIIRDILQNGGAVNSELGFLRQGGVSFGSLNLQKFSFISTILPTANPTRAPTAIQGAASLAIASATSQLGLPMTTIIAIVIVLIVVLIAAAFVFYSITKSKKNNQTRASNIAAIYKGSDTDSNFGGTSPGFAPHIARGFPAQRYSGSTNGGRRSMGNSIELADYRASGYGDADDHSIISENPHFASPRLSTALTRKSLAEHQRRSLTPGGGKNAKYLFSEQAGPKINKVATRL